MKTQWRLGAAAVAGLVAVVLAGCGGPKHIPVNHVVMSSGEGEPVNPLSQDTYSEDRAKADSLFDIHIDTILSGIDSMPPHHHEDGQPVRRVLLFVHGGLNTFSGALDRAGTLSGPMMQDNVYPIFVIWSSDLWVSLKDEAGRQLGWWKLWWPLSYPGFLVFNSAARGVGRLPSTWARQIKSDVGTMGETILPLQKNSSLWTKHYLALAESRPDSTFAVSADLKDGMKWYSKAGRFMLYWRAFPVKLATSPFVSDLGTHAWENMHRRTKTVFRGPAEFDLGSTRDAAAMDALLDAPREGSGSMSRFMNRLSAYIRAHEAEGERYEVVLVGHSMGTILLNDIVRVWPELPYRHIVYMAAACTIREFYESVVPYLEENSDAAFYNLTLHPTMERREINGGDLPHRGTLLNWIDNFYTNPDTHIDRTLGKWENIIQAAHIIPEAVRPQVHLKAFRVGRQEDTLEERGTALHKPGPQKHGDFGNYEMWKPEFWTPFEDEVDPENPILWGAFAEAGIRAARFRNEWLPVWRARVALEFNDRLAVGVSANSTFTEDARANFLTPAGERPYLEVQYAGIDLDFWDGRLTTDTFLGLARAEYQDPSGVEEYGDDVFWVLEPTQSVVLWSSGWGELVASAGYRFVWDDDTDLYGNTDIQGFSGTFSVRLGRLQVTRR